jgi:hypothetical protein
MRASWASISVIHERFTLLVCGIASPRSAHRSASCAALTRLVIEPGSVAGYGVLGCDKALKAPNPEEGKKCEQFGPEPHENAGSTAA